ncbi:cysteine hydrolase family protein [Saccharopolyspora griseoalba]|uniref:Cysteine hydrolase family protein n=1 Tax=Saccharopolyspora griseoalba TaxID=1431848 RepID=A0ABW2LI84_9PSEU
MQQDTALIVVDMQNLFVDIGGEGVIDAVNDQIATAHERGWPVYFTRDVAPDDSPTDAPALDLHPELDVRGTVVPKGPGRSGGFSGFVLDSGRGPGAGGLSPLAGLLRESGVRSIVVVGIAADVCVAATARDALRLGYSATVVRGATAFVGAHPGGDEAAVSELRAAGVAVG